MTPCHIRDPPRDVRDLLVVLLLVAAALVASIVVAFRRWPPNDAPMPEDQRNRARLYGPYLCAAACALLVVDTALICLVTRSGIALILPGMAALFGLLFAGPAWEHRGNAWYHRYTLGRLQQGLPPRSWWDRRVD